MERTRTLEPTLSPWVELAMDFPEVFPVNVGVDLGGREVGMAEHLLDRSEIGPSFEEVGRERMSRGMTRGLLGNPGSADCGRNCPLNRGFVQMETPSRALERLPQTQPAPIKEADDQVSLAVETRQDGRHLNPRQHHGQVPGGVGAHDAM